MQQDKTDKVARTLLSLLSLGFASLFLVLFIGDIGLLDAPASFFSVHVSAAVRICVHCNVVVDSGRGAT